MTNETAACVLIVWRNVIFRHPVTHTLRKIICKLGLNQTMLHWDDIVAARTVKTGDDFVIFYTDRILCFVAIMVDRIRAANRFWFHRNASDALDGILYFFGFGTQFFFIRDVPIAAAAAFGCMRTFRLYSVL